MTYLVGIDEAGYGPNLGPLCIGATLWEVEERGNVEVDLYRALAEVVCDVPSDGRIAIADSKQLYKPGQGLKHLERGVLAGFAALGRPVSDWRTLFSPPKLPWYAGYACPLPIDACADEVAQLAEKFCSTCKDASVRLVDIQVRLVYPAEFNDLTEHYGTKGAALSHVSIELLKSTLNVIPHSAISNPHSVHITCDKHGGRNRYGALLQHHFPDEWVETLEESRPVSRYRWGKPESRHHIRFRSKGEGELPVALASMAAKYHRELAMRAFNAFWTTEIPGLKPTAGYPVDAKRFKAEIATVQSKLEIDDSLLWRNR